MLRSLGATVFLVFALSRPAAAAPVLVQHTSKDAGTTSSSTLAFSGNNTAGNFIAVVIRAGQSGQSFTVSDTRNNVYKKALTYNVTLDSTTLGVYYAEGIGSGANTVSVSDTLSGGTLRFAIFEYSGVATSGSLDGTPTATEGNSASMASAPLTTTSSGDLILGVFMTSDAGTFTAGSGFVLEERVPAAPNTKLGVEDQTQAAAGSIAAAATLGSGQPWLAATVAFRAGSAGPPPPQDLTLSKSHTGSFTAGQSGTYTLTATNSGGTATSGTVTVSDTLPAGLTATAFSGTGWSCTISPQVACTRSDALAAGTSYPALTLTVNVSASASGTLTNTASVSGGGETNTANDGASDPTTIATSGGGGSPTLVQHTSKDAGTTSSSTLAFASSNTTGNFIVVAIRAGQSGQSFTVSDTRNNVYKKALTYNVTLDSTTLGVYYAEGIGGGSNTVSVSDTLSGGTLRFAIFEYSGIATSGSLDGTPAATEGNSASMASAPITTTSASDLILGVFMTSDGGTFSAGSGFVLEERVPAAPNTKLGVEDQKQGAAGSIAATATLAAGQPWLAATVAFRAGSAGPPPPQDLTLTKSHNGAFTAGQSGTYTLTATNSGGTATSGTVTVTDTLPAGLTATAFTGTGWSCTLSPQVACTRSDALAAGSSYPALTLTVSVSASASGTLTNTASVSGGGETNTANDGASDPVTLTTTDPSQVGQWSAVQSWPIVAVHAQLLPTGDVLAWTDYTINNGAQIWHRATNTFTPKNYATTSLFCAGHSFLSDGRLLVAGGIVGLIDDDGPRDSTFFDPATESWSAGPQMTIGRYYPTTTTLADGRIMVNGGTTTCSTCIADMPEIYNPATNSWTMMAASARMPFKYYPHTYQLPDGRILAAAQDDTAVVTQALDLTTQTWTTIDARIIDGHSSVMYLPGKIMKAGKATADAQGLPAVATTYVLDMTQPQPAWQAVGSMAYPRSFLNLTVLPDGQVVATGGSTTTDKANFAAAVYAAEMWSPVTQSWTTMSQAQIPREYHSTALLLPDATVLVAGGGRENGRSQPDPHDQPNAEIFSPPYLFKGPRPVISSAPSVLTYATAFTVTTPDASRIASVSLIALGAVTHAFNENQRYVPLAFETGSGSLNVHAPANGRIAPPGPYMLFLVDSNGVPSTAAMVRLPVPTTPLGSDLFVTKSHTSTFTQGQSGATYTIIASNGGGSATSGAVTVTDTLPAGLTATAFSGTGWSCTISPQVACTRSDALAAGTNYPALTLTVNVSATAPTSVTNTVNVSGGGETNTGNDNASDPTTITTAGSGGPITLVQHTSKDAGTTSSSTLGFASNNMAGNFIAVVIRAGQSGQSFTVSDTRNNVYKKALTYNVTLDGTTLGVYYAEGIGGGANTVSVSDTLSGGTLRFAIFEYAGVATSGSLDGTPAATEGNSASMASAPLTTSSSGDLILGMLMTSNGGTYTAGSGYVIEERVPTSPNTKLGVEDQTQAAAGSIAATGTLGSGQPWLAAVAAFRAAAVAPPPNAPKLIITTPATSSTNYGSVVNVAYTTTGDLTQVNHVHFQMDTNPVVMDLSFDGVFQFTGIHVGTHTLNGWLVRADHSKIAGTDAVPVTFTVAVDPSDPVPPTVSITAPSPGAVSGVVTVTANANDNVGVYGVQFKLDGAVLGAEVLAGAYATDWDTTTSGNGTHTLTAVARDVAGNETTSAQVQVNVSNAGPNDPSVVGQWAGPYNWPLVSVHSMLLPDGKVLLYDDHTTSAGVQVWDPVADTLTARPYNAKNLFCSGHTLLPDGRVLVIGGHIAAYLGIPDATLFDPTSETWSAAASMYYARWYPTATSLPDGRVLAMSGAIDCPTCNDPAGTHDGIALVPEIYDPRSNVWTQLNAASLSLPLYPHMHVIPDGRVVAVGSQEDPIVTRALDVNAQTWTVVDPVPRDAGSSVQYRPGKILKTGTGRNPDYAAVPSSANAYVLDMSLPSPAWRTVAPMTFPRTQHNLTVLPDGNVLAVGGGTDSNVYDTAAAVKTAELWNPQTETWRTLASMQEPRLYHSTSLLLPDGRVLLSGGGRFGPDFPSAEVYSPPYLFKGARPAISSVPPLIQYNAHFSVQTPDGARIAKVTLLRLGSPTHAFDENQRYVELAFAPVAGGLDVTGPTSLNVVLPGYYMLFLVDTNGIPSVSKIVRFPAPWEDTVPPSAPGNLGATSAPGRVDLSWSAASDNTGVALYNIHRGTVPGVTPTAQNRVGQTAGLAFTDTGFASGTYFYVVTAQDIGGNVSGPSNERSVVAQADVTFPVVSVTFPAGGATLSRVVTVTASASDDIGVAGVQFLLDGAPLKTEDTGTPYTVDWNTGTVANGAHALAARARDAAGNTTTSAPVNVTTSNVIVPGLVAAYAFDEASGTLVHDSSQNANTGNTIGVTWTAGHTASGLAFASNNYVDVPNSTSLDVSGKGLTIEMWANITPGNNFDYVLVNKPWAAAGQPFPYYQYGIEYDANGARTLDFYFGTTAGQSVGPVSMLPVQSAWTHVAYTYDGTTIKGYLDGVLKVQAASTASIQARGNDLRLGVDGSFQQGFVGRLDDVRIYNRALTQAEIQTDMGQPVTPP